MTASLLQAYGIHADSIIEPLTSGLINRTWKVTDGTNQFILQQINDQVFKQPYSLAENISMIDQYLKEHAPHYVFVSPISTVNNEDLYYKKDEGYYRLFPFVKGSHTIDVVATPTQAFEAAFQFGKFTRLLSGFDASRLHTTIPDFHNLTLRYRQFEDALNHGNPVRIKQSKQLSDVIKQHVNILTEFERIKKSNNVKLRVTHHDTKISNVLFDDNGRGICIIDLDTIMPGYFFSDVGDMMRTYLSPANEEETNFQAIDVREDFFRAIVQGYLNAMATELTTEERALFLYAGQFLTYMQAIRFLTDYCNNDIYYGSRYEEHNFARAGNQLQLLKVLMDKKETLQEIISAESKQYGAGL